MRTERLGWPAIVALAVLLWLGLWQRTGISILAAGVFAAIAAVSVAWAADIILSTIAYYRHGSQPRSLGEVLRHHANVRTPRTATVLRNVLVAAAAVALVSATVGTGVGVIDSTTPSVGAAVAADDAIQEVADDADSGLNQTEIRIAMHARINEARAANGVPPLVAVEHVAADAETHTEWMASQGRLEHADLESQYDCQRAGENIAYTYASSDIETPNGTVNYYGNETAIAHGLVRQWLNSPEHRENLLDPSFSGEGIGVAVNDSAEGERVFATQALCG